MSNAFKEQLGEAIAINDLLLVSVLVALERGNVVSSDRVFDYLFGQTNVSVSTNLYQSPIGEWSISADGKLSKSLLLQDADFRETLKNFFGRVKSAVGDEIYQEVAGVEAGTSRGQANINAELSSALLATQGRMLDSLSAPRPYPPSSSSSVSSKMSKADKKEKKKKKKKKSLLTADSKYNGMVFNP